MSEIETTQVGLLSILEGVDNDILIIKSNTDLLNGSVSRYKGKKAVNAIPSMTVRLEEQGIFLKHLKINRNPSTKRCWKFFEVHIIKGST